MKRKLILSLAAFVMLSALSVEARFQSKRPDHHPSHSTTTTTDTTDCFPGCKYFTNKNFKGCYSYQFSGSFGPEGSFACDPSETCSCFTPNNIAEVGVFYADGAGKLDAYAKRVVTGDSTSAIPGSSASSVYWDCTFSVSPRGIIDILCDLYLDGASEPSATDVSWIMQLAHQGKDTQFLYLSDSSRDPSDPLREGRIEGRAMRQ